MMTNPHALAIIATAERILPLTRLHTGDQRAAAVDLIGDFYKLADDIDANAPAPAVTLAATDDTLRKLGAGVALALAEAERAYQRTDSLSERHRLAPLISALRDGLNAYRADPATPKAPKPPRHTFEAVRRERGGAESILDRFPVTQKRTADQAYEAAEALCDASRKLAPNQAHFVRELNTPDEKVA